MYLCTVRLILLAMIGVLLTGCAKRIETFSEEGLDFSFYSRVAVLPFENNSEDEYADERMVDILTTAVLKRGLFEVVEKGDLKHFFREEVAGRDVTSLDQASAKVLAKNLKVDAYIAGSVDSYETVRNGPYSYPVVAVTLRMVDANSGRIVWQAHGSESGYRTWQRIFGFASNDIHQVSMQLLAKLFKTL
ncbi:MAG: hypothetical protein C0618_00430 [Desulfuromonas sp.]|nr:MAG: hypothetical protein C0618_00430 [Desulfuromonas sp.]